MLRDGFSKITAHLGLYGNWPDSRMTRAGNHIPFLAPQGNTGPARVI